MISRAQPCFTVDPRVPTNGLDTEFTIQSDAGQFQALGAETLALRVSEIPAIVQLDRDSKAETFLTAVGSTALRAASRSRRCPGESPPTLSATTSSCARSRSSSTWAPTRRIQCSRRSWPISRRSPSWATAQTTDQGFFLTRALRMLVRYQQEVAPLATLSAKGTVFATDANGALVVPAPVDYVSWTQRVAGFAQRDDLAAAQRGIWLTGRMTPRAKAAFEGLGWSVHERASDRP
jgi:hypothetical protein